MAGHRKRRKMLALIRCSASPARALQFCFKLWNTCFSSLQNNNTCTAALLLPNKIQSVHCFNDFTLSNLTASKSATDDNYTSN